MPNIKQIIAGLLLAGAVALPALAASDRPDPLEGSITVFTKAGMMQTMMADTATLDALVKGAEVLDDHSMIVHHGGRMYLVRDHKMADGSMAFQIVEHHMATMGGTN